MEQRLDFYKASPATIKALIGLEERIGKSGLEQPLVELVRLRASQINGCAYCIDMHTKDALKAGEAVRRLMALTAWRETAFFDERERAALLWTETLTEVATRHAPDDIYQQVAAQFNDQELAELTFVIAAINAWNRFGVGFAMQPALGD